MVKVGPVTNSLADAYKIIRLNIRCLTKRLELTLHLLAKMENNKSALCFKKDVILLDAMANACIMQTFEDSIFSFHHNTSACKRYNV